MNTLLATLSIISLLMLPLAAYTQPVTTVTVASSEQSVSAPPPISQPLIREGDLAIELASTLNLGTASSGAEAENILASAGIAPKNGWISDYPVTPVVIGQLQQSIEAAASAGRLPMNSSEAINAFLSLVTDEGLPVQVASETNPGEAATNYGEYSNLSVINNYYDDEGPPVVTYYAPPLAYVYLYTWVPFPFWWSGFWFPGYYCLNDFDVVVFVHHVRKVCTNHFFSPITRRFVRINPRTLAFERAVHGRRELASRQWREHAGAIYSQNRQTRKGDHLRGFAERSRSEKMQWPQASNHFARRNGEERFRTLPNRSMITPEARAFHGSERPFRNFHSSFMGGQSEGLHGGRNFAEGFHSGFERRSLGGFQRGGFNGGSVHARR
jgi:hypothetical protein